MNQLIAQGVHAGEDDGKHLGGPMGGQRLVCRDLRARETGLPLRFADLAVVIIPKGLIDEAVVQQQSDRTGKLCPDEVVQDVTLVEVYQLLQEVLKYFLFGGALLVADVIGVGGVEGNPQEDKFSVLVLTPLRPVQPAQRAMYPQRQVGGVTLTLCALSFFE